MRNSFYKKVDYDQGDEDNLQKLESFDQAHCLLVILVFNDRAR